MYQTWNRNTRKIILQKGRISSKAILAQGAGISCLREKVASLSSFSVVQNFLLGGFSFSYVLASLSSFHFWQRRYGDRLFLL